MKFYKWGKKIDNINISNINITNIKLIKILNIIKDNIKNTPEVHYNILNYEYSNDQIKKLTNSKFVCNPLNYSNLLYTKCINWDNNNIYIKTTYKQFIQFEKRLPIYLKIVNYIKNNGNIFNIDINMYLILSNHKKNIEPNIIINPNNINSGYTIRQINQHIYDKNKNIIFIWRKEEFEKVSFHELIHLFNQDHWEDNNIKIPVTINGPINICEAITEFKALLFNIIYISLITNITINKLIKYELYFSNNQAKYIYNHLKITYDNNIINQHTSCYSYFILKYNILSYFIDNIYSNKLFINIFIYVKDFNKLINELYNIIIHNNNILNNQTFIDFNSSRMSLLEFK